MAGNITSCSSRHNALTAQQDFGKEHVAAKIAARRLGVAKKGVDLRPGA